MILKTFPPGVSAPPGAQRPSWAVVTPVAEVVMAYRELGVIEIREVVRRFCRGDSVRATARGTASDRKTIAIATGPR